MDKKSYIKEHSWGGFKSGVKYSAYLYLGATIASLLISLAVVPIFPFTLLIFNPVVWAMLGVAFVSFSAVAMSIGSPLYHRVKDSINQRKIKKEEGQGREKVVDGDEKQPVNTNIKVESPSSLLESDVSVNKKKLFYSKEYNTLVHNVNNGKYTSWLSTREIEDIAKAVYGYDADLNFENDVELSSPSHGMIFDVIDNIQPVSHQTIEFAIGEHCKRYKEEANKEGGPGIMTLILNLSSHFVTLVTAYDKENGNFRAYYCNSFGNPMQDALSNFFKGELKLEEKDIRSCKVEQQGNTYDCGIYALENAKIITDMMKEGKSFDKIDEKLAGYVHADKKQEEERIQGKRKEFAEALMKSVADKSDSELDEKFEYWGDKIVKEKIREGR
ncbi:Ulp1 family isopeptidase [Wolbachia endosymbiont of Tribolium confusum]|uniref:Ulp1 family isopeptidase n=1 Tax=Wolbachia endosymbiont of Tribolium confusum TaxID=214474 RepID=UPI001CF40363|nr:Ulp1 family isopeptidase [Wolbachia endosymbiont of Tribolium confusum]MCA7009812.1 C48 family peptidase [Wolbachia endosymbiont of Tribolium confusum]